MTPKEKAKELVEKFKEYVYVDYTHDEQPSLECQKQCALIAVDEILSVACPDTFQCKYYDGDFYSDQDFFIAVKREIKKL